MDIYITELGAKLKKSGDALAVSTESGQKILCCDEIQSIIINEKVSMTSDALEFAIEREIPIFLSDGLGNIYGKIWETKFGSTAKIRRNQLENFHKEIGTEFAKRWLLEKAEKQRQHILKLSERREGAGDEKNIRLIDSEIEKIRALTGRPDEIREKLMSYEGNISRVYYQEISKILPEKWKFTKREHQGAKEPYNIILNYLYGILYSKVEHNLVVAGLDPFIGILHTDSYNKPALLLDFIEQFRYLAMEQAAVLFTKKMVTDDFFIETAKGPILSKEKKHIIVSEFYKRLNHSRETSDSKTYTHLTYINHLAKEFAVEVLKL